MACKICQARRNQPDSVAIVLLFLARQFLAGFVLGLLRWRRASRADGDRQGDHG